ncbi:BrnA antitoxin family protein [Chitinibacter sp. S2-10]|uniref:BrnA antitoxin family protein n=1 Tax=Chitinibacter sp. S2-10 TaxID=3373597 RepID=UPI00397731CA
MKTKQVKPIHDDNPEWTAETFAKARPAAEMLPGLFGQAAATEMLKPKGGRPKSTDKKVQLTVRYSAEVVNYFKGTGDGWQTRMDEALREYVATHKAA